MKTMIESETRISAPEQIVKNDGGAISLADAANYVFAGSRTMTSSERSKTKALMQKQSKRIR